MQSITNIWEKSFRWIALKVGLVRYLQAGKSLVYGDNVYVKSDGKLWKADSDVADTQIHIDCADGAMTLA